MLEIPGHLDRRGQPCPRRRAESASQDHAGRRRGRRAPPGSPAGLYFSGLLAILVRSRAERNATPALPRPGWRLNAAVLAVTIYGGYFGAAAGVALLVILLFTTAETLARANAMKNVLVGLTNAVAAIGFAAFGPVHWLAVLPLGAGSLIGGRLGPNVVRRAPTGLLRILIACGGLALAVHLGLNAFR